MRNTARFMAAAVLAVGGMTFVGCQNTNNPDATSAGYYGGMSGGGSTDTYGTGPNARYRDEGNIGVGTGVGSDTPATPGNASPAPAGGNAGTPGQPAPGQTPVDGNLNGGNGGGTSNSGNGSATGSTPSGSSGSSNSQNVPPPGSSGSTGGTNATGATGGGSVLGGTGGNGTTSGAGAGR